MGGDVSGSVEVRESDADEAGQEGGGAEERQGGENLGLHPWVRRGHTQV